MEQSREVFCVPGSIYSPASALTNRLPQEGAKLVIGVDDVLEELHLATSLGIPEALPGMFEMQPEDEATVLGVLDFEPVTSAARPASLWLRSRVHWR